MKVELKSFKMVEEMSEETNCFYAKLYINGKCVGDCENRGHGGSTDYHISDSAIRTAFEAYAKGLPPVTSDIPGHDPFTYNMDAETLIDQLVEEQLKKKDEKRLQRLAKNEKKKNDAKGYPVTVQITFEDQVLWFGCKDKGNINSFVEKMKEKHKISAVSKVEIIA